MYVYMCVCVCVCIARERERGMYQPRPYRFWSPSSVSRHFSGRWRLYFTIHMYIYIFEYPLHTYPGRFWSRLQAFLGMVESISYYISI